MLMNMLEIDKYGNRFWYNEKGLYHRIDGPACEYYDGSKEWYINGKLHRTNGPACEYVDGGRWWWLNGERHREDGPAMEYRNGNKEWYVNGKRYYTEEAYKKKVGGE